MGKIKWHWLIYNAVNKHNRGHPFLKHTGSQSFKFCPMQKSSTYFLLHRYGSLLKFRTNHTGLRFHVVYTCTLPHIIFTNLGKIPTEVMRAVVWACVFYSHIKPKQICSLSRWACSMLYIKEQYLWHYSLC